jgi:hypothetical protein
MPDCSNHTFQSIFFNSTGAVVVRVPDYQRAFAWEKEQIHLFIQDLRKFYNRPTDYYFGHYITESMNSRLEIVDGQQRLTTFVLFLVVCRHIGLRADHPALSIIDRFSTVSYDDDSLKSICKSIDSLFEGVDTLTAKKDMDDEEIVRRCGLRAETFTKSQKRMVLALLQFYKAFEGDLDRRQVEDYVEVVMNSSCSNHETKGKSVAVSVFEMHNTRGVPLTMIEVLKAKLTRFVYDHGGDRRLDTVSEIQSIFGDIYCMEEALAKNTFRRELSLAQLLRLHLRVVDDGRKERNEFHLPGMNSSEDELIKYVEKRLDDEGARSGGGVDYAVALAEEFRKSVRLIAEFLPAWDRDEPLVGDVMILERELSAEFFLLVSRMRRDDGTEGFRRVDRYVLLLWERILFTRDFHGKYYRLSYRDNFPELFGRLCDDGADFEVVLLEYVKNGFRPDDVTKDLQKIVNDSIEAFRENILRDAYHWWGDKMKYAIYKYEIAGGANMRETMKGTISVEHVLPQEWQWEWLEEYCTVSNSLPQEVKERRLREVSAIINGLGNLFILTPQENTSASNQHPADKIYAEGYGGGSYRVHRQDRERWRKSSQWENLIRERGERILEFMKRELVGVPTSLNC